MKGDLSDIVYALILIAVLGFLLVVLGRPFSEGFESGPLRCDLDSPCPGHLKCLNGFCAATEPVGVVESDPVPMLPGGAPLPYFS